MLQGRGRRIGRRADGVIARARVDRSEPRGRPSPTLGRLARYKKLRVLGEGGFGTVWLLREKETNEEWAGKFLRVTDDPRRKDMMTRDDVLNECRVLERMRHQHLRIKNFESAWRPW